MFVRQGQHFPGFSFFSLLDFIVFDGGLPNKIPKVLVQLRYLS